MSSVLGSKQYKSVVVQDQPVRRWLLIVAIILFIIGVTVASFWFGGKKLGLDHSQLQQRYSESQQKLKALKVQHQLLSQKLANANVGAQVDRQAMESVRIVVREHKQTIAELNEEIAFYKGLMAPTERERGLGIRSWELYPIDETRYEYKLVLQQLAVKHSLLKGSVSVELVGRRGVDEVRLSLHQMSDQIIQKDMVLRFKYFQYIEGELQLPEGFVPERVDVLAKANKPKAVQVAKQYGWVVQRAAGDGLSEIDDPVTTLELPSSGE